jgi:hypothetical protein
MPLMSNVSRHMHTLHSWVREKAARPLRRLRAEARATEEWKRFTGRGHYAKLTLVGYPAEEFSLVSAPGAWGSEAECAEYEPYVLDGVLSELFRATLIWAPPGLQVTYSGDEAGGRAAVLYGRLPDCK